MNYQTLTPRGINVLVSNPNVQVLLQVINVQPELKNISSGEAFLSEVSDGYHKIKCYWNPGTFERIRTLGDKFNGCVVILTEYVSTSKNVLVSAFEPLFLLNVIIGAPVSYKEFLTGNQNLASSNIIDHSKAIKCQDPAKTQTSVTQPTQQTPNKVVSNGSKQNSNQNYATSQRVQIKDVSEYQTIEDLYSGMDNWVLFCRVSKSNYREFLNKKKEITKLLEFELRDKNDWTIKCTMFGEFAFRKSKEIKDGEVYTFSQGVIKVDSYKTARNDKDSQYTITFTEHSKIVLATDDSSIKDKSNIYRTIDEIKTWKVGAEIDVVGIIKEIKPETQFLNKTNNESSMKRVIVICDPVNKVETDVTLWRTQTNVDAGLTGKAVALESFKVHEYKGTLSLTSSTKSRIAPLQNHPLNRYEGSAALAQFQTISFRKDNSEENRQNVSCIKKLIQKGESMNEGEEIWSTMRVYINKTKEKGKKWYTSCPNNQCKRQVQDEDFKCGSCQKSFDKPVARYIMSVEVADCLGTGSLWTSAYDDFANKLFSAVEDCPASKAQKMPEEQFAELCKRCLFQEFKLTMKTTWERTQDGIKRLKHQITKFLGVDNAKEARANLEAIRSNC